MSQFQNYHQYLGEQAEQVINEYKEQALQEARDGNDVREFFTDSIIHEWADNDFIYVDLLDSAHILDQSENVESDSGLWEGQQPMDAIKTQAFFTYRYDLESEVVEKIGDILKEELESLEQRLEEVQNSDEYNDEDKEAEVMQIEEQISKIEDAIDGI